MVLAHLPIVCAWFVHVTIHVLAEYCIAFLIGKQASRYNKVRTRLHVNLVTYHRDMERLLMIGWTPARSV